MAVANASAATSSGDVAMNLDQLARECVDCLSLEEEGVDGRESVRLQREERKRLPSALLLVHPWLCDSTQLLDAFVTIYEKSRDRCERRQVLSTLAFWIDRWPFHFDAQPTLASKVSQLHLMAEADGQDNELVEQLDLSKLPSYAWLRALSVRHPVARQVSLSFDQWSPEDLSTSLSHIDFKVLSKISIIELKMYVKEGKLRMSPILERSISLFNNMSNWVQCMVLGKATPKERADILIKFVNVGKHLRRQCNFNTLMAVIGGITHSNIARLGKTHALLSVQVKKELSALTTLLSMQGNYSAYRAALAECEGRFRLPIMGVHLKDLIAASVGFDFSKSGQITRRKLFQLSNILSFFPLFNSIPHCFAEPNVDLINTLKVSLDIQYNDDDIYQLSLKREPRTLLTFEPSSKSIVFADWASGVSAVPDPDVVEKHITAMVDAVFKHYDHDKDSYISQSEFRQIAGNFPFIDPFGTIDVDRDGQISKIEMKEYFMQMNKSSDFRREFKHDFQEQLFIAPTTCSHCTKILWGVLRQGYKCADCGLTVHHSCREDTVAECRRRSSGGGEGEAAKSSQQKEQTGSFSEWFSPRNSHYNSSFRKMFSSYRRHSRMRTSSAVSVSPEPPVESPTDTDKCKSSRSEGDRNHGSAPDRLHPHHRISTRSVSESTASLSPSATPHRGSQCGRLLCPDTSSLAAALAAEEVFDDVS